MRIVVLGPLANATTPLLGTHYKGAACPMPGGKEDDASCVRTVLQELTAKASGAGAQVVHGGGCAAPACLGYSCVLLGCSPRMITHAVAVAKAATQVDGTGRFSHVWAHCVPTRNA